MEKQLKTLAIGLDGARGGWVAARLRGASVDGRSRRGWTTELLAVERIQGVEALRTGGGRGAKVAIDLPIGLPDAVELRGCDLEARELLADRRSSVFAPPPRPILGATSFADIQAWVKKNQEDEPSAKGLSRQSFGLVSKVREVDEWLLADSSREQWFFECHPELAFQHLNNSRQVPSKRSPAGLVQRLQLVLKEFPDAEERLHDFAAPRVDLSDALDAYACLSVALRHCQGRTEELGGGECDTNGLRMRMVI